MKRIKWFIILSIWVIYWAWEVVEARLGFETFDPEHLVEIVVKLSLFSGVIYFVFRQIEQRNHKVVDLGAYYESIVDNAATGVIAVDREGRITTWNRYMEEEYKIKRTEVMKKNIFEFFSPIQTDGIGRGIKTVLNAGQPLIIDRVRHKTKRVGERIIDFRFYPLKDILGKVVGAVLLNDDVTEKIKTEEELEKTREQLIQAGKLASTGQLAAGVAHELNNPLTSISGFAQLLLSQMNKKDPGFKGVKTIVEETKRCRSIIQNLLSFSRQSQKEDFELLSVNLPLEATMGLVKQQMKFRDIELMEDLNPDLPSIKANPNQLQQVFMNLIVNAQDAMPQGGRLYIETRMVQGSERVEIVFRDTGSGISEEDLDKIFNPFFTTKRPGRGVGLGLSVSYGIIEEHGGRIEVQSKVKRGSTFTITLPTKRDSNESR